MHRFEIRFVKLIALAATAAAALVACATHVDDAEVCKAGTQCVCKKDCDKTCEGDGSNCQFVCEQGATCSFKCAGGSCQVSGSGNTTLDCPKGGCKSSCDGDSCKITSCTSNCTLACSKAKTCTSSCSDVASGCTTAGGE